MGADLLQKYGMDFTEKVILITGSSRGIGAAIAKAFGELKASVIINYKINKEKASEVSKEIEKSGGKTLIIQCDVRNLSEVKNMVEIILNIFGKIDVLVNNASTPIDLKGFLDHSWEDMMAKIDEYIKGAFNCCKEVIPCMMERRSGRIINIMSAIMSQQCWGFNAYSTAKGGLFLYSKQLAYELAPYGITVNMVSPGIIRTDMTSQFDEDMFQLFQEQTPMGRLCTVNDVANAVIFYASELSSFITGSYLAVDGGREYLGSLTRISKILRDDFEKVLREKYPYKYMTGENR